MSLALTQKNMYQVLQDGIPVFWGSEDECKFFLRLGEAQREARGGSGGNGGKIAFPAAYLKR